jgi:hypothetical protein
VPCSPGVMSSGFVRSAGGGAQGEGVRERVGGGDEDVVDACSRASVVACSAIATAVSTRPVPGPPNETRRSTMPMADLALTCCETAAVPPAMITRCVIAGSSSTSRAAGCNDAVGRQQQRIALGVRHRSGHERISEVLARWQRSRCRRARRSCPPPRRQRRSRSASGASMRSTSYPASREALLVRGADRGGPRRGW